MLKLESVDVAYGHVQALAGVSIEVRDGELVTLLGANGAGKSTTLMAVSGIVRPRAGTLTYDGVDLARTNPFDIVRLGVIHCPEGRRIFGGLSVLENLRMGSMRRAEKQGVRRDIDWVFSLFPVLAERRRQAGATLSGGEQQMLAIGRALMARPTLLMLDEPSMGLAPVITAGIFKTMLTLREQGLSILLVEQNARRALSIADRGYVIETGQMVIEGAREELLCNNDVQRAYLGKEYSAIND
jgi:branched-chain amino acid transport system ATP-binding protein